MPTALNIIAHADDDLIFGCPDLISEVQAGFTIWTTYLTAGNVTLGPAGIDYAHQRVLGVRAAYARMARITTPTWVYEQLSIGGRPVATNRLSGSNVRLLFLYLNAAGPDDATGDLSRLWHDGTYTAAPIDGRPAYNGANLRAVLRALVAAAAPTHVRGHDLDGAARTNDPDNVDHIAAAHFTAAACSNDAGVLARDLHCYVGYAIRQLPENQGSAYWRAEKAAAIAAYEPYDPLYPPGSWNVAIPRQYRAAVQPTGSAWVPRADWRP